MSVIPERFRELKLLVTEPVEYLVVRDFRWTTWARLTQAATSLAGQTRFNGYIPYTVAQHSVLVSYMVAPHLALAGLLHDVGEMIIGDLVAPIRHLAGKELIALEDWLLEQVAEGEDFPCAHWAAVKSADRELCRQETVAYFGELGWSLTRDQPVQGPTMPVWPAWPRDAAREAFIRRYTELRGRL